MSVTTTLPTAAAPTVPRRLSLQEWLSTQPDIDLDSEATVDHRTWVELVAAYSFAELASAFAFEMEGAIHQALKDGILPEGGFLADPILRAGAIRAALVAGCADVAPGKVETS